MEKAKIEARKKGHGVAEQLADGSIKLTRPGGRRCRMKIIEIMVSLIEPSASCCSVTPCPFLRASILALSTAYACQSLSS